MTDVRSLAISRRSFLYGCASTLALSGTTLFPANAKDSPVREFKLRPGKSQILIDSEANHKTPAWGYNNTVPGPELRLRQGEKLRIVVENSLDEDTTVHWHGLRIPNGMDGVPHLTQKPIASGESFTYEFTVPDAGTYWYHPHIRSSEQVGRGLYGPLIVEEHNPINVDRDITWVMDDWRLTENYEIRDNFNNRHDMAHGGRVGNTITINGIKPSDFRVRRGERIRLRLINAANARIFRFKIPGHNPRIIAYDGQPVSPHSPPGGFIVLAPAMRIDLVIDMMGQPEETVVVEDRFYRGLKQHLFKIIYSEKVQRQEPLSSSIILPANNLPEPDLKNAVRHTVEFGGGMMGRGSGMMNMMEMMRSGKIWRINGVAATGHIMDPMLSLPLNQSTIIDMNNDTAWYHPIHLHGHSFRVISRNGQSTRHQEWQDTVLMAPREKVQIAFVADNPGDWMFHCHILEHQASGMMGVIRVKEKA